VLAAAAAGVYFFLWPENPPPPPPPQPPTARVEVPAPPPVPEEPRNPVPPPPPAPEQPPLPPLKQSDPAMLQSLATLLGAASLERFFNMEDVVRRIVATVDNLPREAYASRLSPLKPIPGLFATTGRDETLQVSPANAKRYADFVAFADRIDAKQAVSLYIHYYPLFQQAYVELGYPKGYFNDRLVTVIDHLLAAPEVKGPVPLTQPHVLYEYADPEWEARSAGHKALMRVGPENAARLKAKLREIRKELVARRAAR
jgi:hypothetical protein